MLCFCFHLFPGIFCVLPHFYVAGTAASESVLLFPQICHFSSFFFRCRFLTSFCCGQRRDFVWDLSFKIYWNLTCGLLCHLRCRMSCELGKHVCAFLVLGGVFSRVCSSRAVQTLRFFTPPSCLLSGGPIHSWEGNTHRSNYYSRSPSPFNSVSLFLQDYRKFPGLFLSEQMLVTIIIFLCTDTPYLGPPETWLPIPMTFQPGHLVRVSQISWGIWPPCPKTSLFGC